MESLAAQYRFTKLPKNNIQAFRQMALLIEISSTIY